MSTELLVYASDVTAAEADLATVRGRVIHVLAPHLVVILLPDGVDANLLQTVSPPVLERLDAQERLLADIWLARFGTSSRSSERLTRAATAQPLAWDAPGFTPPNHMPGRPSVVAREAAVDGVIRSTNTATSRTLTGSVAVGVVMVSGPPEPPAWTAVHGALIYVSAAADGTVCGVNANHDIFRWNSNTTMWEQLPGELKQISVGDASNIWGVNRQDEIYSWNGASWDSVAGALKHVSVARDQTVWGVNRQDKIFRRDGSVWQPVQGRLKQISVGDANNIWGVNSQNEIYQFNGAGWTQVSGHLAHVSVASDGSVFGVNTDNEIFVRNAGGWTQIAGALTQISSASASDVWGVNRQHEIYTRKSGSGLELTDPEKWLVRSEIFDALDFLVTADPEANLKFKYDWKDVTVDVAQGGGDDYEDFESPWRNAALREMGYPASREGSELYVNSIRESLGTNWAYAAYITKYPLHHFAYASRERLVMAYHSVWGFTDEVFAHETCHIFGAADEYEASECNCDGSGHNDVPNNNCVNCNSAPVECLMWQNSMKLCEWTRGQLGWSTWQKIGGALVNVSAAADGTVCGVNANHDIFRWNSNTTMWEQLPGALKQISVGDASNIWGVNRQDEIYSWNGSEWDSVAGALKHVSVARDGTVWGVNSQDKIFRRDNSAWQPVQGRLKQISVGDANNIWGVNSQDEIYQFDGPGWTQVSGHLAHVSVASDGSVFGVNSDNEIFVWNAGGWTQIAGALTQISAASGTAVWGVNSEQVIFRRR